MAGGNTGTLVVATVGCGVAVTGRGPRILQFDSDTDISF